MKSAHRQLDAFASMDSVTIAGQLLDRPSYVSVKQWLDHWDAYNRGIRGESDKQQDHGPDRCDGCGGRGYWHDEEEEEV